MEPTTQILVGVGIVFGAFAVMFVNLNRWYKEHQRPEDGHERRG
jgi:hypothetical protein